MINRLPLTTAILKISPKNEKKKKKGTDYAGYAAAFSAFITSRPCSSNMHYYTYALR